MRPTVRGVGVALVGAAAVAMAATSGARALNAIAAPAIAVLVAGAAQLLLAGAPELERTAPADGFPGDTRTVSLSVDGGGVARIEDDLPEGLATDQPATRAVLPAAVSYEIDLRDRGAWTIGPPRVVVTDVLGLFVRTFEPGATASVLVYPRVAEVRGHEGLARLFELDAVAERGEFDTVREYAPGDPLRDVHWKGSAKHEELIVKQFVDETAERTLSIAATATPGHADEMAAAAAGVALFALRAGRSVSVTCPRGRVPVGQGDAHRRRILELLARTDAGDVPDADREGATVAIVADDDGVRVRTEDRTHPLEVAGGADVTADGGRIGDRSRSTSAVDGKGSP